MSAASPLARVRRLAIDGRLPPETTTLLRDAVAAEVRRRVRGVLARLRPACRAARSGALRIERGRRWQTAGPLDCSHLELAQRHASLVVDRLQDAGIAVFVVDTRGDQIVLGIDVDARAAALDALVSPADRECPLFLHWRFAGRSGVCVSGRRRGRGIARRAYEWSVHQQWALDERRAIGSTAAAIVTFWTRRAEYLERVGVRGSERFHADAPPADQCLAGRRFPGRRALPVGTSVERMTEPVDIVFTWVDGSDPAWQRSFAEWAAKVDDGGTAGDARHAARYRNNDELRYALRSVWLNAGWVRRIHLVTCGHTPWWLGEHDRIRIVPHTEILPADALPTFNSHAIEAALHHVPELAEHFIYFNDDVFLARPVQPEDFFTSGGLPRISLSPARVPQSVGPTTRSVDLAAYQSACLIEAATGKTPVHKPSHGPFPLRRSDLYALEARFADAFERTMHHRFRTPSDLSVASSLAPLFGLATGTAALADLRVDYVNIEHARLRFHLSRLGDDTEFDSFCLNETEVEVADRDQVAERVRDFLEWRFPVPAPWEAPAP